MTHRSLPSFAGVLAAVLAMAPWASAQARATLAPLDSAPESFPGPTPRSAVAHFLEDAHAENYAGASEALRAPGRVLADPEESAEQLRAVLDRFVWIELAALSDRPEGRLDDGLAPSTEEIARITTPEGPEPVRLVRLSSGRWVFARETVARIPEWYALLRNRWIREQLPSVLMRAGPFTVEWWQWIALPLLLLACGVGGWLVGKAVHWPLRAIVRRMRPDVDGAVIERMGAPRTLLLTFVAAYVTLPLLELPRQADSFLSHALTVGISAGLLWALFRTIDLWADLSRRSGFVSGHPSMVGFLPLGTALAKLLLFVVAFATMLEWLGLPVASVFASLGIGGLAIALAAKTSLENLLGALTLGVDKPLLPGDFVRVDGIVGTVEEIGVRSTRIRTQERTLITIPNGRLADMRIESLTARDRLLFNPLLTLRLGTTAEQVEAVVHGIEKALREHPLIYKDDVTVAFREITPAGLVIEVLAWFHTTRWAEFVTVRHAMLLACVRVVDEAGTSLAVPVQNVRIAADDRPHP